MPKIGCGIPNIYIDIKLVHNKYLCRSPFTPNLPSNKIRGVPKNAVFGYIHERAPC